MAALTPRLASGDPAQRKIAAGCRAVLLERGNGVNGTGGFEAAGLAEPGAKQQSVRLYKADQQALHHARAEAARSSSCRSSALTAALSLTEAALTNSLRSKPARRRTTCAACGNEASEAAALTVYICRLIALRVTARRAQRLGTMAPIHTSRLSNRSAALDEASSAQRCNAKWAVRATVAPASAAWNCARVLSRCMEADREPPSGFDGGCDATGKGVGVPVRRRDACGPWRGER